MNDKLVQRWNAAMMGNYGDKSVALVRGEGSRLWDADGNEYLDFASGVAVNALGHAHPAIVEAVTRQVAKLGHVANFFATEESTALAERLLELIAPQDPSGRVFFCNSGAEANEAAFKLARLTGRPNIVTASNSFHGRTMGALALTGQPAKQQAFAPMTPSVTYVPYGDSTALRKAIDENTAAVFLEPIQGEAGVVVPPTGYLAAARVATNEVGALLILDEVQTGIGRTGQWFAHHAEEIQPDVITLAKGLGGGLPIGACVAFGNAAQLFKKGDHGSTFGGNPIACAAALAVLDTIERDGLLDHTTEMGERIRRRLSSLPLAHVKEVRGIGLLIGIELHEATAAEIQTEAERQGIVLNAVAPNVLRVAPPLIITESQVDAFLETITALLQ